MIVTVLAAFGVLIAATATTPGSVPHAGPTIDANDLPDVTGHPSPSAWHGTSAVIEPGRHTTVRWVNPGRMRLRARQLPAAPACTATLTVSAGTARSILAPGDEWAVLDGPAVSAGDLLAVRASSCPVELDWITVRPASWTSSAPGALWDNPAGPIDVAAAGGDRLAGRYAHVPTAVWLTEPATAPGIAAAAVNAAVQMHQVPTFVVYAIPDRDCATRQSVGGAGSADGYRTMIGGVTAAIGSAEAVVIVEPDALALDCGNVTGRLSLVAQATASIAALAHTHVYLDAGHPGWRAPAEIAARLVSAGVAGLAGFSVNVANFATPAGAERYGEQILDELTSRGVDTRRLGMIVDVSRAGGTVPAGEFCNPPDARLGPLPTLSPGSPDTDAWLWVKPPGESDGQCGIPGAPAAGTYWLPGLRSLTGGV